MLFLAVTSVYSQQRGNLEGVITDANSGEQLPGVNILLKGTYYGAATSIEGKFRIENIVVGDYIVAISLIGYKTVEYTDIKIEPNKTKLLDVKLEETVLTLEQDIVVIGDKPLMDVEETQSKKTVSREEIDALIVENIQNIVTQQAGVVTNNRDEIHIRGGRQYENAFL